MDPNNPENNIIQTPNPLVKEEILNNRKPHNYLLWLLIGAVIVMFITVIGLIIIGINLIKNTANNISNKPVVENTVVEQPTVTAPIKSKFATDAGVLKIRDDLTKLRSDIDSTDLFETQLSPPNLDLNISIQTAN